MAVTCALRTQRDSHRPSSPALRHRGTARLRRRLSAFWDDLHGPGARIAAGVRRPRRGPAVEAAIPGLMGRPESEVATRPENPRAGPPPRPCPRPPRLEQTPETSFVLAAALRVPRGGRRPRDPRRARHRDLAARTRVAQRRADGDGRRTAPVRLLLEVLGRAREGARFSQVSDATRAAWAWRRYVTAAEAVPERTVRVRYEQLVTDPAAAAGRSPRGSASTPGSSRPRSPRPTTRRPAAGAAT